MPDPAEVPSPKGPLGAVLHGVCGWAPVWVPLGLFCQITLLGLGSALEESERLEAEMEVVTERLERWEAGNDALREQRRAHADPIYVERERRLGPHVQPVLSTASTGAPSSAGFAHDPRPETATR